MRAAMPSHRASLLRRVTTNVPRGHVSPSMTTGRLATRTSTSSFNSPASTGVPKSVS